MLRGRRAEIGLLEKEALARNPSKMVAEWGLSTRNRFEVLKEVEDTSEDLLGDQRAKKSSLKKVPSQNDGAKRNADKFNSRQDTRVEVSLVKIKTLMGIVKIDMMLCNLYQLSLESFQMAEKNVPIDDSMSLLHHEQGQEEDGSQQSQVSQASQDRVWVCPIKGCSKAYKYEKLLSNHLRKIHESEELEVDEEVFPDDEEMSELVDSSRKRPRDEDDEYDSDGTGEKSKHSRGKLYPIKEEEDEILLRTESLDLGLLDNSFRSTQDVHDMAKVAFDKAEQVNLNLDLDETLEEEERVDMAELKKQVKAHEALLNTRGARIAELEAENGEFKEAVDQLEIALKKTRNAKTEEAKKSKVELENRDKIIQDLKTRNIKVAGRMRSPGKDQLKDDLEKTTTKLTQMTNKVESLQEEAKAAISTKKKIKAEAEKVERMRESLKGTMREQETIKRELDDYKKEMAKAKKKIPCTREGCNTPRDCEYSHILRYEDRSQPREERWSKRTPCRFLNYRSGCKYSAEECDFYHDPNVMNRYNRRLDDSVEVLENIEEQREENSREWQTVRNGRNGRGPIPKRRRTGIQDEEPAREEAEEWQSGNGNGAGGRSHQPAPRNALSRRSSVTSSGSAGGQPTAGPSTGRRSRDPSRGRQWSPENRPRQRGQSLGGRDARQRIEARRGRRSTSRGPVEPRRQSQVRQEKRFSKFEETRRRN